MNDYAYLRNIIKCGLYDDIFTKRNLKFFVMVGYNRE